ncbi:MULTISPECIES: pectinesterase family protein [Mesonia]|uniref:Pectinesterase A n=1 Tax=Mesonia oceanica TaxID=2687242 RepID=A0AC61Y5X4_9FLAO|nr:MULTISPECIES: pectinesterase family protein [Mesonia]MAN28310.1 hypothetical protein [Mesonia sp.]MAQ39742.1 hypothetical protein [Mesonia sp.]VVU99866.1 Pectinesterase A [Mesonia oceanica]|tara:strand:+ start:249 stop:3827 length:3579 start_codon:yes stop_codon:yes gene_type:complete
MKKIYYLINVFMLLSISLINAQTTTVYNFTDGEIISNGGSDDGLLNLTGDYNYHSANYGLNMKDDSSITIIVTGSSTVTFLGSQYSSLDMHAYTSTNEDLGTLSTTVENDLVDTFEFSYTGGPTVLTFELIEPGTDLYLPELTVTTEESSSGADDLIDVWDFGAQQLSNIVYDNQLTETVVNSWYDGSITPGSDGNTLPDFTVGDLSWIGGGNDRLRTTNTNLTRFDGNVGSSDYQGRLYVNASGAVARYISLELNDNDIVQLVVNSQNGNGTLHFEYADDPSVQTNTVATTNEPAEYQFVANSAGTYHIYDSSDKPSYYRIYRQTAQYVTVSGTVDVTLAPAIPSGYSVVFTNDGGNMFTAEVQPDNTYSIELPMNNSYMLSLQEAEEFIITAGDELSVGTENLSHDISIEALNLFEVSGNITGLPSEITNLNLYFVPNANEGTGYLPTIVIDESNESYTANLEAGVSYTVVAEGVNDYQVSPIAIGPASADITQDLSFEPKPVYTINVTTEGLSASEESGLQLTFTNIHEEGYAYTFGMEETIEVRDGTYSVSYTGIEQYPVELAPTAYFMVNGEGLNRMLSFEPVHVWSFDDTEITNATEYYKGLVLQGSIYNDVNSGHLSVGSEASIQIPVQPQEKVILTYYYAADFTVEGGDSVISNSGTTSMLETYTYIYEGTSEGYITVNASATTYFTEILSQPSIPYASEITVGTDKEYQTINQALDAVGQMIRPENERVTIIIDPGNYEEMLTINEPNVTLKNASNTPDTAILNEGVDISSNAVRITSYYGTGYNYYSMGSHQKWDAQTLDVNMENGELSTENTGSGTTNGSYWNATVVVYAEGFEAEHIVFENSFNQYISQKEANDMVIGWDNGSPGERPTDYGNTSVQDRSLVERAAAIALAESADKAILNQCKIIGRQDAFYGGKGSRVLIYKGSVWGAVDYIFGGMTAVFYQTELTMNVSDVNADKAYLTAAHENNGRGMLMYDCKINSTIPGVETASAYSAKPGYFGRPWYPNTSEVVFYNTTIETSDYPGNEGESLIVAEGWNNSLGGESNLMYEYGTNELSGEDNSSNRAVWSTLLNTPYVDEGNTEITTFNFTKGDDDWDPLSEIMLDTPTFQETTIGVEVLAFKDQILIRNVQEETNIKIYNMRGALVKNFKINSEKQLSFATGMWIITAENSKGAKVVKVLTY